MTNGSWFVIFLVVYEENYDAPWVQFIAGGVSQEEAALHAANTERISALERTLPVHMKRGGQTVRHVIQVQARDGVTALMRAQAMLRMQARTAEQFQLEAGESDG